MALSVVSPCISPLSHSPLHRFRPSASAYSRLNPSPFAASNKAGGYVSYHPTRASSEEREAPGTENSGSAFLDDELLTRVSSSEDSDRALEMIAGAKGSFTGGVVEASDCNSIIAAALDRENAGLAVSMFSAMRSGLGMSEKGSSIGRWRWAVPNVRTYTLLVKGLAACLRVSDAIKMISYVSRVGVSPGEEVPFGMIVQCPNCLIAVAVAQPQHGIQAAPAERSMDISAWEKTLKFLKIMKGNTPAAVHSIVICFPFGTARTYRFATNTVELPAQEGERVTISLAAPSNVYRNMGPLRLSAKPPGFSPGEPMCITNHSSGQVSQLLRAPVKDGNSFLLNPSFLLPATILLATGDLGSGIIDPSLPRLISVAAVASVALGTTINRVVLPQLSKLPQRTVDVVVFKQQLLSQYDFLQTRIKDLRHAAENEVWMLARMCQLEKKIIAVGEPSYRARRERVKRVREGLESSLLARIELIESYAKISSMIEIEVEMDSDVLAAEAVSNAENIAEQIQQIMEIENLEEGWRIQAEANDEVERLLNSQPMSAEHV